MINSFTLKSNMYATTGKLINALIYNIFFICFSPSPQQQAIERATKLRIKQKNTFSILYHLRLVIHLLYNKHINKFRFFVFSILTLAHVLIDKGYYTYYNNFRISICPWQYQRHVFVVISTCRSETLNLYLRPTHVHQKETFH